MADDRIEIEVVLDDGSIQKGFAKIRKEGDKTERSLARSFDDALDPLRDGFKRVQGSIFNLRNALGAAVAVVGGGAFIRTITEAAAQQEEAVNALNVSLQTAGTFSQEASESFQELATQLQANSRFGDEVILQQAALARNFARSNEEAERLVAASVDLSEATGISLDSAIRNLGKTFSGLQGELGESIPQLRNLTAEQLKAGEAINLITERFGGAAVGALNTFNGATAQLSNTFGDFLEGLGKAITDSPVVIGVVKTLSQFFGNLNEDLKTSAFNFDQFFIQTGQSAVQFAQVFLNSFRRVINFIDETKATLLELQRVFTQAGQTFLEIDTAIGNFFGNTEEVAKNQAALKEYSNALAEIDAQLLDLASSNSAFNETLDDLEAGVSNFSESLFKNIEEARAAASATPAESPVKPIVDAVSKDILKLRKKVKELQVETKEAINNSFLDAEEVLAGTPTVFETLSDKGEKALKKLEKSLQRTRDQAIQLSQQVGQAINNGIANTITNAVASTVEALRSGQDAFGAFAKAALATIGDLAVQLGTTLIASGIGIEALKVLGGAAAIAAGIALVAVGTLIKGAAGGGAPTPSGASSVTPPLADLEPDGVSDSIESARANVQVNIEGNLVDPEGSAIAIADLLKEQGFSDAVVS